MRHVRSIALLTGAVLMIAAAGCTANDPSTEATTTVSTTVPATTTSSTTTTSTTTTTTTTTTTLPPTTTTEPFVTEGAVVLVANAADVPGAATRLTEGLAERGFQVAEPTNAAGYEEFLDVSKIYAAPGAEAVAESVSRLLGGIPVSRMPTPAPIVGATVGLDGAGVLVMLGRDLAKTL